MMKSSLTKILPLLLLFFFSAAIQAQENKGIARDTSKAALSDSTAADTTKAKKTGDIDAVVYSTAADSMIMNVKSKKMQVFGKGSLKYKATNLKGGQIFVDYNINELEAFGAPDSTGKLSKDTPVLTDGGQSYEGERMRYNFKTQQGYIAAAKNKVKDTRYEGEKVKKVDKETFFIEHGVFTTCNEKEPHTHFSAAEMKVITDDKIIAKWVFMHIAGIPLPLPLPMAVIPNQTGRRSGIIMPGYGEDVNRGLYLSHLGYFFALSDYYDLALTTDLFSRGGFGLKGRIRYNKRYSFSGEFNAGFTNRITSGSESREWNLSLFHNQKIDPTSSLVANLQFQSASYNTYNSYDYNNLLRQQIISSATYSKSFEDLGASLSLSYNRTQNISDGTYTENLPSVNFSKTMFYPFKGRSKSGVIEQKWYDLIGVNYSASFDNRRVRTINQETSRDTVESHMGVRHDISINASPKIGYFTLTPSLSYQERWYNKRIEKEETEYYADSSGVQVKKYKETEREVSEFNFVRTFSLNLSASTKLYGIMPAGFLGIEAFRHTITPSISYNYTPDFSADTWGYYGSYRRHDGTTVKYDKFSREVYSGVSAGESQSISFGIGNLFEMKTEKDPTDTTSQSQKIQLLNFSLSSGYNFTRERNRLQDLNAQFRTQIGNLLDFSGSAMYSFYDYDGNGNILENYLASAGKGLFRITSFYITVSTNLSPETFKSSSDKEKKPEVNDGDMRKTMNPTEDLISPIRESSADYSIPWNLGLSFNYNSDSRNPSMSTSSASMSANFSMNLTKKMKISFYGNYDFQTKQFLAPQINISRDIHCWEMNLRWNPLGAYRGFYFVIRMKAPEFQDIKYEKTEGQYSGRF